jgi:hypothetical protein
MVITSRQKSSAGRKLPEFPEQGTFPGPDPDQTLARALAKLEGALPVLSVAPSAVF